MAFGKSFSMAKSSIKEKSMEYLRNVTNRSIAEPQDTTRGRPTTPSPPPDPVSTANTPSTSTPTPKKPKPNILSTPPSTYRSKHLPQSRRNASSSSILEKSAAKQKQIEKEKEKQEVPHTDPLPFDRLELEGLRNNLVSQLQKLADRAEWINEWMEMDAINLARLVEIAGREDVEREGRRDARGHQVLRHAPLFVEFAVLE
ncbi:hypothetical protein JMJ35_002907 [Cladonia borealis]|uniref:Uncharacterized protein n=1 Tax=Cladonia borealis TaxID=184061 RepID=A0AA39V932_9LECA|nr:hypothetical protein JMJ35_002907 [Cladonia borealis]